MHEKMMPMLIASLELLHEGATQRRKGNSKEVTVIT